MEFCDAGRDSKDMFDTFLTYIAQLHMSLLYMDPRVVHYESKDTCSWSLHYFHSQISHSWGMMCMTTRPANMC